MKVLRKFFLKIRGIALENDIFLCFIGKTGVFYEISEIR